MLKVKSSLLLLIASLASPTFAQKDSIYYEVETQAIATSNGVVPFWMRSNQYGSVPLPGVSGSFLGRAHKEYSNESANNWFGKEQLIDWGAGFEGRANLGDGSNLILVEAYAKMRLAMFELKAGRTKDVMGLNGDTSLSSGNFAVSGNALGVPKVEISIPEYWTLPFADGLFAIKGNFAHGWVGDVEVPDFLQGNEGVKYPIYDTRPRTYLHQKSFYGRFGMPAWKLKLYGGFNHQVFWGDEKKVQGENFKLTTFQTFLHVISGAPYGSPGIPRSKIGNQLGSIDLGLSYQFNTVSLFLYRQNIYDVGALVKLANIRDGLNGVVLKNTKYSKLSPRKFQWEKFLVELLYTKHQAGEFGSKYTKSGDEDYYNNYYYRDGWSYRGLGLGTPVITKTSELREELPVYPGSYFGNNRVISLHFGSTFKLFKGEYGFMASYSWNYGTFGTSPEGHSLGEITPKKPIYGLFGMQKQFSGRLKATYPIKNKLAISYIVAMDAGSVLENSLGGAVSLSKSF